MMYICTCTYQSMHIGGFFLSIYMVFSPSFQNIIFITMGFEILVAQRTDEWFELRNSVSLTASQFGDALGVGRGRPVHI